MKCRISSSSSSIFALIVVLLVFLVSCVTAHYQGRKTRQEWKGEQVHTFAQSVQHAYDFNLGKMHREDHHDYGYHEIPIPVSPGDISNYPNLKAYLKAQLKNRTLLDHFVGEGWAAGGGRGYWSEVMMEHAHQRTHTENQYSVKDETGFAKDRLIFTNSSLLWYRHALSHLMLEDLLGIENLTHNDDAFDSTGSDDIDDDKVHGGSSEQHEGFKKTKERAHQTRRALVQEFLTNHLELPLHPESKPDRLKLLHDDSEFCPDKSVWEVGGLFPHGSGSQQEKPPGWCFLKWPEGENHYLTEAHEREFMGQKPPTYEQLLAELNGNEAEAKKQIISDYAMDLITKSGVEVQFTGLEQKEDGEYEFMKLKEWLSRVIPEFGGDEEGGTTQEKNNRIPPKSSTGNVPPIHLLYESITRDMMVPRMKYREVFARVVEDVLHGWHNPFEDYEHEEEEIMSAAAGAGAVEKKKMRKKKLKEETKFQFEGLEAFSSIANRLVEAGVPFHHFKEDIDEDEGPHLFRKLPYWHRYAKEELKKEPEDEHYRKKDEIDFWEGQYAPEREFKTSIIHGHNTHEHRRQGGYKGYLDSSLIEMSHLTTMFVDTPSNPAEAWCIPGADAKYVEQAHEKEVAHRDMFKVKEDLARSGQESDHLEMEDFWPFQKELKEITERFKTEINPRTGELYTDEDAREAADLEMNPMYKTNGLLNDHQSVITANTGRPVTFLKMQQLVAHELAHHVEHLVHMELSNARAWTSGPDGSPEDNVHPAYGRNSTANMMHVNFLREGLAEAAVELIFAREGLMPRAEHLAALLLDYHPRFANALKEITSLKASGKISEVDYANKKHHIVDGALAVASFLVEVDDYKQQISWRTVMRVIEQLADRKISKARAQLQFRREALILPSQWPSVKFFSDQEWFLVAPYALGKHFTLIEVGRWAPLDWSPLPFPLHHEAVTKESERTLAPRPPHPFHILRTSNCRHVSPPCSDFRIAAMRQSRQSPSVCTLPTRMDLPSHLMPGGHDDQLSSRELKRFAYHDDKWWTQEQKTDWIKSVNGVDHVVATSSRKGDGRSTGDDASLAFPVVHGDYSHSLALAETLLQEGGGRESGEVEHPPPPKPECLLFFSHPRGSVSDPTALAERTRRHRQTAEEEYHQLFKPWTMDPLRAQWKEYRDFMERLVTDDCWKVPVKGGDWWTRIHRESSGGSG